MGAMVNQNLRFAAAGILDFSFQVVLNINFLQSNPLPHIINGQSPQFPVAAGKLPVPSAFAVALAAGPLQDVDCCECSALQAYDLQCAFSVSLFNPLPSLLRTSGNFPHSRDSAPAPAP